MQETFIDRHCAALPGTARTLPFGDDTVIWTVYGHMFTAYMMRGEGLSLRMGAETSAERGKRRRALTNPYLSGADWVLVPWGAGPDELRARIDESYGLVLQDGNAVAGE